MSFAINTNIASLQAQEYLRTNSDFQSKTINRVTSGLRIISSGDDAAGLAIANTFRSDQSVLSQGVRNANDGLSQLQIADGGISNISKLLDRARTLATQSASGAFTGERSVLSGEFATVLGEIDRQAQAIGLNTGGTFAKSLGVFIGGGKESSSKTAIQNGSVTVDLSHSTVDAQSLGLKGVQATGNIGADTDIGTASVNTSVEDIVAKAANVTSQKLAGHTDFVFRGAGFSDAGKVNVSVNLSGVTDVNTLVGAINTAIENAGNGTTQSATAFKNAGISASVVVDDNGSHLAFSSNNAAFQVAAGDLTSNALLGNVTSSSDATGLALANTYEGGANVIAAAQGATRDVVFRFQGSGLAAPEDVTVSLTSGDTGAQSLVKLQAAVAANANLQTAGIEVTVGTVGSKLKFGNGNGEAFTVDTAGDIQGTFGMGSFQNKAGAYDYKSVTGVAGTFVAASETIEISVGGGAKISLAITVPAAATVASAITALNDKFNSDTTLSAAGFKAVLNGAQIDITNDTNTNFRISTVGAANVLGFNNFGGATGLAQTASTAVGTTDHAAFDAGGAYQTDVLTYAAAGLGTDNQTITLSANSPTGAQQSLAISLRNDGSATSNARSLDETIATINAAIQESNNPTLRNIVAVKEQDGSDDEGIKFISTTDFKVGVGATADGNGIGFGTAVQGGVVDADLADGGSTADISTQDAAQKAVTALASAVSSLDQAQAVVGRGQNQFGYAINLASSQLTNLAAAESRIRDADLASEAANLTKAQTLLQAGIVALAQANSAPQAVLALLRG